jgi:hypothetical protein
MPVPIVLVVNGVTVAALVVYVLHPLKKKWFHLLPLQLTPLNVKPKQRKVHAVPVKPVRMAIAGNINNSTVYRRSFFKTYISKARF